MVDFVFKDKYPNLTEITDMLIDFTNAKECQRWITINDDVMGGISQRRTKKLVIHSGLQGHFSLALSCLRSALDTAISSS